MTRFLVGIIMAMLLAGGTASAAEQTPLRTIVYSVTSSRHCSPVESGYEHGTLTIAIIAAPPDQSLVADVAFTGESIDQPSIQVTIARDGSLSYNPTFSPTTRLCPEVGWVVPLLARGLLPAGQIVPGNSWEVSYSSPWSRGFTWYRVDSVEGAHAVIAINAEHNSRRGFEQSTGTMTYATDILSPISLDLDSLFAHVAAERVSDSFDRR
jgi:hypothetical protein